MKLRVRYQSKTTLIELQNSATFGYLHSQVQSVFQIGTNITLSLNNRSAIDGTDNDTLSDLGLVSGDLIYVMLSPSDSTATSSLPTGDAPPQQPASIPDAANSSLSAMKVSFSENVNRSDSAPSEIPVDDHQLLNISAENTQQQSGVAAEQADNNPASASSRSAMSIDSSLASEDAAYDQVQVNRYLNEPMVVRDATATCLPQTLVSAFDSVKPKSAGAALLVAVDVLMSELGYHQKRGSVGPDWHMTTGTTRLFYEYPQLTNAEFHLQCVPMCNLLIIHGFVRLANGVVEKTCLRLVVSNFIHGISADGDATAVYIGSSLAQLSKLFKDAVGYPLLQSAFKDSQTAVLPALDTVFHELQIHIMKFLNATSLVRLSAASKHLCAVARQPVLWRRLFVKDFGRYADMSMDQDWLALYKEKFIERKKRRSYMRDFRCLVQPPFADPTLPTIPLPFPFRPPGSFIIGGEYDLCPSIGPDPFLVPDPLRLPRPLGPDAIFDGSSFDAQLPSVHPATVGPLHRHPLGHSPGRPFNARFY